MASGENPFDEGTIWDPNDHESAIEDPYHGPSAVFAMLQTPAMPNGDGTYYQPGMYGINFSGYEDPKGNPILTAPTVYSPAETLRFRWNLAEWVAASSRGQSALTALEARRQRERLEKNGYALSFKPSDVCAGGQRLEECDTARSMIAGAEEYAANIKPDNRDSHTGWSVLAWLGKNCTACSMACETAVQNQDGNPTGITRFANYKPRTDIPTIEIKVDW